MKTINRLNQFQEPEKIGATRDELEKLIIATQRKSGQVEYFSHDFGLNKTEYVKNLSHIHVTDGDKSMNIECVSREFLNIPVAKEVYYYNKNNQDYYVVVLTEDLDDISFQLAKVKVGVQEKQPDYNFEIRYVIESRFNVESIPSNFKLFSRG